MSDTGETLRSLYANEGGVVSIFSSKVNDYLASRPDYPPALFSTFVAEGVLQNLATIADIGSGTGLLTASLLVRGHQVFAVEPNAEMRFAADTLLNKHGQLYQSIDGTAENLPLPDASVDLITAAQAFHWFEIKAARHEFMRVLKPQGQVALIWNDRVLNHPLHLALNELLKKFGGAKLQALSAHEDRSQVPVFFASSPTKTWTFPHQQWLSEEGLQSLVFSRSYMPERHSDAGEEIKKTIKDITLKFAISGKVAVPYQTTAIIGALA